MASNDRFTDMAKKAFSFLEGAGFRLSHADATQLQYETARVIVTIEWDARSGDMDASVGLQPGKGERQDAFSLSVLLGLQGADLPERKMPFQVAEENRLGPFLEKLADDMRAHAQPALAGDRMFFRRLKTYQDAQAQRYVQDMELQRIRSEADKAWRERRLGDLVGLYTSIASHLTASEKAKLDYARKHGQR
jgi:hypothetical protein